MASTPAAAFVWTRDSRALSGSEGSTSRPAGSSTAALTAIRPSVVTLFRPAVDEFPVEDTEVPEGSRTSDVAW